MIPRSHTDCIRDFRLQFGKVVFGVTSDQFEVALWWLKLCIKPAKQIVGPKRWYTRYVMIIFKNRTKKRKKLQWSTASKDIIWPTIKCLELRLDCTCFLLSIAAVLSFITSEHQIWRTKRSIEIWTFLYKIEWKNMNFLTLIYDTAFVNLCIHFLWWGFFQWNII